MTMRQKKGIRTAVLSSLFLLLAIGTFDSRHGFLSAQQSSDITSGGKIDLRKAEDSFPVQRLAAAQALPQAAPPRIVEIEKIVEAEKVVKVVKHVQAPVKAKPTPTPWESSNEGQDGPHLVKKPDPVTEPEPNKDLDPGPDAGLDPGPGDEPGSGAEGDRNRGHGNDEDGYDEDNPGRGGFGGM